MNIESQQITYHCNGKSHLGYFSWDSSVEGPRPGVVIIHEWWGLNDYMKQRANQIAQLGYCALAIDMYGEGLQAESPDQAGEAMNSVLNDMQTGTDRLRAAYDTLLSQSQVDANNTAAMGYCFGGAMALHMARIGMPLKAVVSFHGALGSFHKANPGEIQANILVCHGGDDAMVSMDDVAAFKDEMSEARATFEVIVHAGAQHGFTSVKADENGRKYGIPVGYDANADSDSWDAMKSLFARCFTS